MTEFYPVAPSGRTDAAIGEANAPAIGRVREAAMKLEASFLSEMLKAAGFGARAGPFSGGTGEDQFASFQRDAVARQMAMAGGLGLAEQFVQAMMEAQDGKR